MQFLSRVCADARRHNGNELLFCSPIALADFSCFLTLQRTVSPTFICLCGPVPAVCGIYDRHRCFERALALAPESVQARYYLGNALFLKGKTGEALSQWRKVVRAQPNFVPALNEAAGC